MVLRSAICGYGNAVLHGSDAADSELLKIASAQLLRTQARETLDQASSTFPKPEAVRLALFLSFPHFHRQTADDYWE
jgi:hypothetical protein